MHSSRVYSRLSEGLGLAGHLGVLTIMLAKIAVNLKVYGQSEQLVHLTLTLFQVSNGLSCLHHMSALGIVEF